MDEELWKVLSKLAALIKSSLVEQEQMCQSVKSEHWDIPDNNGGEKVTECPGTCRTLTTSVIGDILKSSQYKISKLLVVWN